MNKNIKPSKSKATLHNEAEIGNEAPLAKEDYLSPAAHALPDEPISNKKMPPGFRMVGIGASAGGLEALTHLFRSLPSGPGLAFVVVQHLAKDKKSALVHLLKQHTSMTVEEATHGAMVKANHIYVIPPDRHLAIKQGRLQLSSYAKQDGANMAIDFFFCSLAEDQGAGAIGVVLSGAGTDGARGLKAIKEAGGITFAQEESSAKFPSMPRSAALTGCADLMLPPEQLADELVRIAATMILNQSDRVIPEKTHKSHQELMNQICMLLLRHSGVDFSHYKQSTIQRRIERRMLLLRLPQLEDYVERLKEAPNEIDALYNDILINVTRFFRDSEVFDALKSIVLPSLLQDRPAGAPLRIWVPGCASGEEVYSIAICVLEYLAGANTTVPLQIFGSDIDDAAVAHARAGHYPLSVTGDLSEERIEKFFIRTGTGYQIKKHVREHCIFSRQNLVKDPPFSNLDFISCRNVLIYLGSALQARAISVFHYALKPAGFLMLGTSESVGGQADLFKLLDQPSRIHIKKSIAAPLRLDFGRTNSVSPPQSDADAPETSDTDASHASAQKEVDRLLLAKYSPPAVVVDDQLQIRYFRGETASYLQSSQGEASLNLLKMARGNLTIELRLLMNRALADGGGALREKVQFRDGAKQSLINIEVIPLLGTDSPSTCFLVLFEEAAGAASASQPASAEDALEAEAQQVIDELRHELTATKEYLQSAIAQHEVTSSELSTAGEELQSNNEELQSINEELESAKEELQSSNEELAAVNDELERRNVELAQLNSDLTNLVDSTSMPAVMVDRNLCIRRFTQQATTLLSLIPSDIGRPFTNIKINMAAVEFGEILQQVVASGEGRILEAQDDGGRWFSVRFSPYRAPDRSTDGATVVFVDIDEMKRSADLAKEARDFAEAVIAAVPRPLLVLDKDLRVVSASRSYLEFFSVTEKNTVGNLLYYLGNGQWGIPRLREALEDVLSTGAGFDNFVVRHHFELIGETEVKVSGRYIAPGTSRSPLIFMQIEN